MVRSDHQEEEYINTRLSVGMAKHIISIIKSASLSLNGWHHDAREKVLTSSHSHNLQLRMAQVQMLIHHRKVPKYTNNAINGCLHVSRSSMKS